LSYPLTMLTDVRGLGDQPAANWILEYEQDQDGLESPIHWLPGFIQNYLPDGLTRYIAGGSAVSAPSENLGFYFSGIRWGSETRTLENVAANTLITVNMPTMGNQTWLNNTLPDSIPGRINAELVWIPVSQSGVLIAIGGVLYSEALTSASASASALRFIWYNLTSTQAAASVSLFALFFSHGG
jgi:hypothetical protein